MNKFAKNLKELRTIYNYTQRKMATILGISQVQYFKYENGLNEPNIDTLIKIAAIFDISVDELIK